MGSGVQADAQWWQMQRAGGSRGWCAVMVGVVSMRVDSPNLHLASEQEK